jgi:ubiquitin C-terminal hydrolase
VVPPQFACRTQETTLINHVYGGYLRQQTECMSCGYTSRRFEHFMDVAIEIPSQVDDLDDALATYCAGTCQKGVCVRDIGSVQDR